MTRRRWTGSAGLAAAIATLLVVATASAAETEVPAAPIDGPCASPRQALRTLLHWQTPPTEDVIRAATCVDRTEMESPAQTAPAMAAKLKKVLDGRGLFVDLENVPDDPEFKDDQGQNAFDLFPDRLGSVLLVRQGHRWVFPPATLDRVGDLYRETYPLDLAAMMGAAPLWLRLEWIGVAVWQVLGILLLIGGTILLQRMVILLVATTLHRLAGQLGHDGAKEVAHRSASPLGGLAMAGMFAAGMPLLQFPVSVNRVALFGARVLAAASLVWLGYRMADVLSDRMARKASETETKMDDQLVPIVRKFLKFLVGLLGGVFILHNLDVNIGSILAGLGLGGAALAFAAKDSLAHFFGSLMIFLDKPFQIGDFIKVGSEVEGTVEEVGFRSTRVRTPQDSLMTVPNAKMAEAIVDNLGVRKLRRYRAVLGLVYGTPPDRVEAFCEGVRQLLEATDGVVHLKSLVEFQDLSESSLSILLNCFIDAPTWEAEMRIRSILNLALLRLAVQIGVEFAFPTRTIHVASMPRDDAAPN
jgi:MscS family membrane protein